MRAPRTALALAVLLAACDSEPKDDADRPSAPADTASAPSDDTSDSDDTTDTDDGAPLDDTAAAAARTASCAAFAAAGTAFLDALDARQREVVRFELEDPERFHWSNLPVPVEPRAGLALGDMTEAQATLAWALLEAGLSATGYAQARDIVAVDEWWATEEGSTNLGERFYTWAIHGTPGTDAPWAFQFDGHHLVYNFTSLCDTVVMAPNLLGVQPTRIPDDGTALAGLEAMAPETDTALAFVQSLSAAQLEIARASTTNDVDLLAGPGVNGTFPEAEGIYGADLADDQRALLVDLLNAWISDQDEPFAAQVATTVAATLDATALTWHGPIDGTPGFYYRVRGPAIYVEYDYSGVDHIHAVYRDPENDYGLDLLAAHRARFH